MTGPLTNPLKNKEITVEKTLKVWGKGPVRIFESELDCYILEDGTPVDIIISPLSILSRMNLGQLYETLTGIIAKGNNMKMSFPVWFCTRRNLERV